MHLAPVTMARPMMARPMMARSVCVDRDGCVRPSYDWPMVCWLNANQRLISGQLTGPLAEANKTGSSQRPFVPCVFVRVWVSVCACAGVFVRVCKRRLTNSQMLDNPSPL